MQQVDKNKLFRDLVLRYRASHPKSEAIFKKTARLQARGGSHNLRLFQPFPFYDVRSSGSRVTDVDGHTYVDFWQGHFSNILGHNPPVVLRALLKHFRKGQGLSTGFPGEFQRELAGWILKRLQTDKIRFTTSGTLGSMYAVMLAQAFTGRDMVLKAGGGWHGAHPYLLKGISAYRGGFRETESGGVPPGLAARILVTRFNDPDDLERQFHKHGERIACFILEPFIGAGGFIFSRPDYLKRARELTRRSGALLILDEVVSGFRFHPGGLQSLYGVKPDLTVLGKAIGGGMPVSAVAGRDEVMALCGPDAEPASRVKFEGGTFSAHPACMLAGLVFLKYLELRAGEIYPKIGKLGALARRGIEDVFRAHGFNVKCTGSGEALGVESSLVGVNFLSAEVDPIVSPEEVWNPEINDVELREKVFKLAMIQEGFNVFHGYGSVSFAHTAREIQASLDAVERIAKKWKKYRPPKS